MKVGTESNAIYVGSPNRILDVLHAKMSANIDSINDKVYLEFYDVLKEDAFDPKSTSVNDFSNLKLLSHLVFDVKDFTFSDIGVAENFRVLMPIENSGNVASFTLQASFTREVPIVSCKRPLQSN